MASTAIVTDVTSNFGIACVKEIARRGYHTYLIAKSFDPERLFQLRNDTKNQNIFVLEGSLKNLESSGELVDKILALVPQLDILLHTNIYSSSIKGSREIFQSYHLGPLMITVGLIPLLEKSEQGRVLMSHSTELLNGKIDLSLDPQAGKSRKASFRSAQLWSYLSMVGLSESLKNSSVTVNSMYSGILMNSGFVLKDAIWQWAYPLFSSSEAIAGLPVWLATSPQLRKISGRLFIEPDADGERFSYPEELELALKALDRSLSLLPKSDLVLVEGF